MSIRTSSGKRYHLVIFHGGNREADVLSLLVKGKVRSRMEGADARNPPVGVKLHALLTEGIDAPTGSTHGVRVGIVQEVQRVARFGWLAQGERSPAFRKMIKAEGDRNDIRQ